MLHQVYDGLQAACQQGIIHCGKKPQNVLLAPDGTMKVTGFGVAKAIQLPVSWQLLVEEDTDHFVEVAMKEEGIMN